MTSRYCYCPAVYKKIGRRVTILDKIRKYFHKKPQQPDLYPIVGYYSPVYPSK